LHVVAARLVAGQHGAAGTSGVQVIGELVDVDGIAAGHAPAVSPEPQPQRHVELFRGPPGLVLRGVDGLVG
jgi:hypothetical protein